MPVTSEPEPRTMGEIGVSGLKRQSGLVYEEYLPALQGPRAQRIYKEIEDNDAIAGAMLFAIDMFLRKVGWFVQDAGEDAKSVADGKFLRECKEDMGHTWSDFISEANSMLPYGWAWFEILYKKREDNRKTETDPANYNKYTDGKIGWHKFAIRSQDSLKEWLFGENGSILGMIQQTYPDFEDRPIPLSKSLLFRTTSRKNNPEGRSIFRNAYRSWYFKKRIEEIEGIGVERDLAGLPFAEVPAEMLSENATEADRATVQAIKQLLMNVRRDEQEGVIWPQTYDPNGNPLYNFKLMSSGGTRAFSTDQIITRYEQRMAMTCLTDFILLGNESTGSFALSTDKTGMFQAALGAWLDSYAAVLNMYAIPRLFAMNGIDGPYPQLVHEEVQEPSIAELATFISALAGAGASLFPDVELENHLRSLAKMPERDPKPELVQSEDELRAARVVAELAGQKAAEKLANNPPPVPVQAPVTGKQPGSTPGAPTKATGPVKSKKIPNKRRTTETGTTTK